MTVVVNLFAGPGVGKSTTAAGVFHDLKLRGYSVEIAHEVAKDFTWEERHRALAFQPYTMSKQIWRVHRLLGQVEAVITDSPILLASVYRGDGYSLTFEQYILDTFKTWDTLNFFLTRGDRPYNDAGRNQTEEQARAVDNKIAEMLHIFRVPAKRVQVDAAGSATQMIAEKVIERLGAGHTLPDANTRRGDSSGERDV